MSEKRIPTKMYLEESELPRAWYNVNAVIKHDPTFRLARAFYYYLF